MYLYMVPLPVQARSQRTKLCSPSDVENQRTRRAVWSANSNRETGLELLAVHNQHLPEDAVAVALVAFYTFSSLRSGGVMRSQGDGA